MLVKTLDTWNNEWGLIETLGFTGENHPVTRDPINKQ